MNKALVNNYLLTEKNSKFYCYIFKLEDEKNFNKLKDRVIEDHPKATHIVYAYRIKSLTALIEKAFNAKEPKNTASSPLLKSLRLKNAINLVIIIARYYGGTNLGSGLLYRTYLKASIKALETLKP